VAQNGRRRSQGRGKGLEYSKGLGNKPTAMAALCGYPMLPRVGVQEKMMMMNDFYTNFCFFGFAILSSLLYFFNVIFISPINMNLEIFTFLFYDYTIVVAKY
jgi:hypothetical protein